LRGRGWRGPLALFAYAAPFSFAYLRLGAAGGALVPFRRVPLTMIGWALARGRRPPPPARVGLALAPGGLGPRLPPPPPPGAARPPRRRPGGPRRCRRGRVLTGREARQRPAGGERAQLLVGGAAGDPARPGPRRDRRAGGGRRPRGRAGGRFGRGHLRPRLR